MSKITRLILFGLFASGIHGVFAVPKGGAAIKRAEWLQRVWLLWSRKPVLRTIDDIGLPVRVVNLLRGANIYTVSELASLRVSDLRKVKGLGDVYCAEIERVMVEKGLWR